MIDDAAEVERILDGSPSKLAFRALCAAVSDALVPQCEERLASWPDELREAPWSWLAALDAGYSKPGWRLVRSLALKSGHHIGTVDPALPDPRTQPEVRGVTRLDLGYFASDELTALLETIDHWDNLRALELSMLTPMDAELIAKLADSPALARFESLNLVSASEDVWHFEKPPFRPVSQLPRLRHVGLRAPDLIHLLRSGLAPNLRSADVLVCDLNETQDLAACAELAGLDRLAVGFRCGRVGVHPAGQPYFGNVTAEDDDACEAFFARADLAGLRDLTIRGIVMGPGREGLGARGVDAVIASGVLRQLTELTLELLPLGDAPLTRVVESVDHDRIEKLTLKDLVATDATAFVGAFPRLRHLDLSHNRLGPTGARQLADVQLPALEHLDLSGRTGGSPYYGRPDVQPVGDAGVIAWASSPNATNLTHLNLAATGLGPNGLAALMRSERLGKLAVLDVSGNPVGSWPAGPIRPTLHSLTANDCALKDEDIEALVATGSAPHLRGISLAYNSVGSRGARALAAWTVLPQLWALNLHDHIITDDGLIDLATAGTARRLLELDLEQDCWNANARKYRTPLPPEVIDQASFPNLDAIFLGIVDEYHGARYSSGFPAQTAKDLAAAGTTRPELVAFLTHVTATDLDDPEEFDSSEPAAKRAENDFRARRPERHTEFIEEAQDFADRIINGDIGWP